MRKTQLLGATGTALVAVFAVGACYDFDGARQRCSDEGRCEPHVAACTPVPGEDLPDDAFKDTDCDGVDGQADAGLFIDPVDGDDDAGTGTRTAPLRTVGRALAMLRQTDGGARHLFLAGGAYDEADLVLDVPVSLHGGYAGRRGGWRRSAEHVAQVDAGTLGMTVRGLQDAGVVMEYVHVSAASAAGPGEPSIAVRMVDSSGFRMRHVTLTAGRGGPGAPGTPGAQGKQGLPGGSGQDGGVDNSDFGQGGLPADFICPDGTMPTGGFGASGSADGDPGKDGGTGTPEDGGGAGGAGGNAENGNAACSGDLCICNPGPGMAGLAGADGGTGSAGQGGMGLGLLQEETWVPGQEGEPGGGGTPGGGGGGGGSGGSCYGTGVSVASGGGSGAGGSGGCGGEGGGGGGGGGASISLLLIGAQVAVEEGSVLRTLGGGQGGPGGEGGPGGLGGEGGQGSIGGRVTRERGTAPVMRYQTTGGRGGPGGPGGNGGPGGSGGGGGGGPSVGVWCGPGSGIVLTEEGVTFDLGLGGPGGVGPGLGGQEGEQRREVDCATPNP
ncbi:hypothetical protein [Myxococcus sp. Y35]|uniref:hypothetical protein n=1 Tax=Pseudomyxococcus flavus TaxID=3115648 RepID=UPI003CF96774